MAKILIQGKEYDVKLNTMFVQPHLVINDITTDIGIWDGASKEEEDKLLILAAKCYEYNKERCTLRYCSLLIHESEKEPVVTVDNIKTKKWWDFIF